MVVRAQKRAGGREAACACVAAKWCGGGGVCSLRRGHKPLREDERGLGKLPDRRLGSSAAVSGQQVVGSRAAAMASATGGTTIDV